MGENERGLVGTFGDHNVSASQGATSTPIYFLSVAWISYYLQYIFSFIFF